MSIWVINFSLPIWTLVSESVAEISGKYVQFRLFVIDLMLSVQTFMYWKNKSPPHPNCILTVAVLSAKISLYFLCVDYNYVNFFLSLLISTFTLTEFFFIVFCLILCCLVFLSIGLFIAFLFWRQYNLRLYRWEDT